jgi:hypothetical protein
VTGIDTGTVTSGAPDDGTTQRLDVVQGAPGAGVHTPLADILTARRYNPFASVKGG